MRAIEICMVMYTNLHIHMYITAYCGRDNGSYYVILDLGV